MDAVRHQEASSSTPRCAYDVFLSFRGEDTRKTFTDHLYTALDNAGIHTFRDDDGIERGENIDIELQRAIQESRISIIVFSKDYASSRWCLNELVRILKCRSTSGHHVLPVFYDVDPSDVTKQTGSFEDSFLILEKKFKAEVDERKNEWMDKIKEWRAALREVADLAGLVLQNQVDGYESKFIQKIVTVIEDKLKRTISSNVPFLIGLENRARNINLWLEDASTNVSILAICGMGGVGKTTLARHVYNLNSQKFRGSSFLADVRETCEQPNGLVRLQKQLLLDILNRKQKIHNVYEGTEKIKHAVCLKKVFVVLDDVDQIDQIDLVLEFRDWLYPGSKIIITTRHEGLLKGVRNHMMHRVGYLDDSESFKLFSHHAFYPDNPPEAYVEHAKRAVMQCGGLPLALKVLGSTLRGERRVEVWINALEKLKAIPANQILKKLRISYDSLSDDYDKNLFLDIACFFVGKDEDYTRAILDGCGCFTIVGIQNLIDRCMLEIEKKKLKMHHWLRDMGREIVRQESPTVPGRRSRLWHYNDSFEVLRHKTGTETIEGLILNMHTFKEDSPRRETVCSNKKRRLLNFSEVALETSSFGRMHKLRLLQLDYVELKGDYQNFPKELKFLGLHGFPLKYIPGNLCLESLVVLDMSYSKLIEVWKGAQVLGSLKTLVLSHSHRLVKTSNFAAIPNLERLILKDCASLDEVHESIENLERLVLLDLEDCTNLRKLPKGIGMLKFLETLNVVGCSNLVQLPAEMKNIESLKTFYASGIAIKQSDFNISWQTKLWQVFSRALAPVPRKIQGTSFWSVLPPSLVTLSLSGCNLLDDAFPTDFTSLPLLRDINLSRNPITKLPECIRSLTKIRTLSFLSCNRLRHLVQLPSVALLYVGSCTSLQRITEMPSSTVKLVVSTKDVELVENRCNYKLEPIGEVDADIINSLGLCCDLESMGNMEMNLFSRKDEKPKKLPLQGLHGLHERGIFSTFIPGREVLAGWLSNKNRGCSSSLSFIVPNNGRIRCLNVCSVYALSNQEEIWNPPPLLTKISNKSKGVHWIYGPKFFAIPEGDEHVVWLSQWKLGKQFQLEGGDELNVTIVVGIGFRVKECAVDFVYYDQQEEEEEEEEEETKQQNYSSHHPNSQGVRFGDICSLGGRYFIHGLRYRYYDAFDWVGSEWGKKLFEDSTLTTEEHKQEFEPGSCGSLEYMQEVLAEIGSLDF